MRIEKLWGWGATLILALAWSAGPREAPGAQEKTPPPADDPAALKAEVARLKGLLPDQAHAMADVGQHFTNLWHAGESRNWPLAQFFSDETRSHLRWAVRIIPKRKDAEGREIDLQGILSGLETSTLKDLDLAIKGRDSEKFAAAYRLQLEACMACHRASSKPYLKLRIPERPDSGILDFKPD